VSLPGTYSKKMPPSRDVMVVDFFCGAGGTSWGFVHTRQSHLKYHVLGGIDIDQAALATYTRNIGAPGVSFDIRVLAEQPSKLEDLFPALASRTSEPLVFIGTPPCQGFSAHRRKDDRVDSRNDLVLAFSRVVQHYRPDAFVIENVGETLVGRHERYFAAARELLSTAGYHMTEGVLDLSLFGVPQRRRRAVVLGSLSVGLELPEPVLAREDARTVRQAIGHLPAILAGQTSQDDASHRAPRHTERILEKIQLIPADGGDLRDLGELQQLECHTRMASASNKGFSDVYGRLRWDTPSVTITAKCSTPSTGRFLHPCQHRNISIREAAILQGFPQSYEFEGPLVAQYRQIGEAVPPIFARTLAWQVLDHLRPAPALSPPLDEPLPDIHCRRRPPSGDGIMLVDAFCGAGGLSLGFERAGFHSALAFDSDADAVATYRLNLGGECEQADAWEGDLPTKIDLSTHGENFVLVGGPPCQGFSQQRRGGDVDERNELVGRYGAIVEGLRSKPLAVVLENVTYLDSPRGRHILERYVRTMRCLGYVVERHDLNSADFGVPQLRHRILVVAVSKAIAPYYHGPEPVSPERWPTVGESLSGLPSPSVSGSIANHLPARETELNRRRIAYVDQGFARLAIPHDLRLASHQRYDGHLDVYGRLDWYGQARTITGGFDSFTRGEYAHPWQHRSITPREAARLQGFPDWFEFTGNRAAVRRQVGNAVPPPLATALANALRSAIECSYRGSGHQEVAV
jgi:DNA (cytosine-5)-methyltransferase 1